jgi:selenocysteine-specific elongation factor
VVIDPTARKHRRFDAAVLSNLETSSRGTPEELVEQAFRQAPAGMTAAELGKVSGMADVVAIVDSLKADGRIVELDGGRLLHASVLAEHTTRIRGCLSEFHRKNPLKSGMPKEELRITAARTLDARAFAALLAHLERQSEISMSDAAVSLPGREVSLTPEQQAAAEKISEALSKAGVNVPLYNELIGLAGLPLTQTKDVIEVLVQRDEVVKVGEGLYFHRSALEKAERMLREYLEKHGKVTVSQFRDLIGSSRKYVVPLLEYFDSKRVTRRMGDERVLVKKD